MKKKTFLHYPEFPGGKIAFQKYISENQLYPEEALMNHIEGIVYLSADVNDNGKVAGVRIEKGLGYGCDEEAIRLLLGMHFGSVTNRGFRLKTRKKFRIPFRMKKEKEKIEINYSVKKSNNPVISKSKPAASGNPYSYSIQWTKQASQEPNTDIPNN
jgi:TonB family protein